MSNGQFTKKSFIGHNTRNNILFNESPHLFEKCSYLDCGEDLSFGWATNLKSVF